MKINRTGIAGHNSRQIYHLLLCAFTGIWRCMEINRINFNAAFCNHIACNRGINASGQKQHRLASRAHRHSSGTGNDFGININFLSDLNIQQDIGIVHIHLHFRICFQNRFPHIHINGHGILGIILAGTSGCHLKGFVSIRIHICNVLNHGVTKLVEALILHIDHRADAGNTEYLLQMCYHFIKIKFRLRIHINTSLGLVNQKLALTFLQGIFYLMHQSILK